MRIAVNAQHLLFNRLGGLGQFTHETLKRLVISHPEHEFLFIFDRNWSPVFIYEPNVIPVRTFLPSRHPLLWYLRFQFVIPRLMKKYRAALFLSTDGWSTTRKGFKTMTVIHDIDFWHHPQNFPFFTRIYFNHFFKKFAFNATQLATVSEYSKHDLVKSWGLNPDNIDVIYNGSLDIYQPLDLDTIEKTRMEITRGAPFFIYVGSLNPRKNIEGMLRAFDQFKQQSQLPHKLVIVGEIMWKGQAVESVFDQLASKSEVLFLGRQPNEILHHLIGSSVALVLVSHLEGFGIPLIEAMNCDVPVICSNTTAMPEVAGNAGHLVDPSDIDSIAMGFFKLATDDLYRTQLVTNARIQKTKFSWDISALKLWNSIEKCINS